MVTGPSFESVDDDVLHGIMSKALLASRRRRKTGFLAEKREKLIASVRSRAASTWLDPVP